MITMIS